METLKGLMDYDPAILHNHTYQRTDVYKMAINPGGVHLIQESGMIAITFVDGKFEKVDFSMTGKYSRNGWRILAAIEAEITRIENTYKEKK